MPVTAELIGVPGRLLLAACPGLTIGTYGTRNDRYCFTLGMYRT